ncbi:cytochrome C oxidase subunit IV family protein [Sphingobium sp. DEHP117]|uniref:cytochrome C oxidase subunit IV family protein n=1 Tax=Sphingobium sp. DEHP117 TaxID=2993436 RepID=UPI0027D565EC|nr:cytochrome C oxidase subunit IV family protein [Sphingobium sp. DEHP117]MDQ4420383.1 cytochrome C oxidase subunit IV family protein [Sphingobium sp. DEHP117]
MRLLIVWAVLVAATLASFVIGEDAKHQAMTTAAILAIAFFKARLVLQEFMEVNTAPILLRVITDAWVLGVGALLIAVPFVASR